jgi:hypothetical protein
VLWPIQSFGKNWEGSIQAFATYWLSVTQCLPSPELLIDEKGTIKVDPKAILQRRMIPRNNEPVIQWLIHWINMLDAEARWEDADFIRKVFPSFHA